LKLRPETEEKRHLYHNRIIGSKYVERYAFKVFTGVNIPAKRQTRVCQDHAGDSAFGATARHFPFIKLLSSSMLFLSSRLTSRAAFSGDHGVTFTRSSPSAGSPANDLASHAFAALQQ
jgi:hypothetical protein